MADAELANFSLHALRTPWVATNFYEILGVPQPAVPKSAYAAGFQAAVADAAARRLVEIPTVSTNMEIYARGSLRCWSDEPAVKGRYGELMCGRMLPCVPSRRRKKHAHPARL